MFRWIAEQRAPFRGADVQKAFPQAPFAELKNILITLTRAQFIKMFWFAEIAPSARVGAVSHPG